MDTKMLSNRPSSNVLGTRFLPTLIAGRNSAIEELGAIHDELAGSYNRLGASDQSIVADIVLKMAIAYQSALPGWRSSRFANQDTTVPVADGELLTLYYKMLATLKNFNREDLADNAARTVKMIHSTNMFHLTRESFAGKINVAWWHDSANGLFCRMLMGAGGGTTNPPLVLRGIQSDPHYNVCRARISADYDGTPYQGNAQMILNGVTVEVIRDNAILLSGIHAITNGLLGYISFQLDPRLNDAEALVEQAQIVWPLLTEGPNAVRNVMFKVPATTAGAEAAKALAALGIPTNATVCFTISQVEAFARIAEQSKADRCALTLMSKRLEAVVAEELEAAGVPNFAELAQLAGNLVMQRAYQHLYGSPEEGGLGFTKSHLLGASIGGPHHILGAMHNQPQMSILTIFPDQQDALDTLDSCTFDAGNLMREVPATTVDALMKSESFSLAYEPGALSLDDVENYEPAKRTMREFRRAQEDALAWAGGGSA